jgi:hypothetical protein
MPLTPGTRLGPYEIVDLLGAGGMGEVYRARDPRLHREVAVKVLPAEFSRERERLQRFEQEARAAAALDHPNITVVYDFGTHEEAPYVVSELLHGATLRERLSGPFSVHKAIDHAVQIANGVAAAHERGIVHRDLKPENVFVTNDGRVKILDFGLAKLTAAHSAPSGASTAYTSPGTQVGVMLGTVGYMAPEQVRGEAADHRADIFALGAILYEMLAGERAFKGGSTVETLSAILKEEPPDLVQGPRPVPPAVDRIVRHCLEKSPEARFQSARDLAFDLQALSSDTAMSSRAKATGTGRQQRLPRAWTALAGLVAGTALTAAVLAMVGRSPTEVPSFEQLTFRRGTILAARFAADDGQNVIYSAAWGETPLDLFTTQAGSIESRALGFHGADLLAVSRSGDLAVALQRVYEAGFIFAGTLAQVPLSGGAPREILEHVQTADWAPDGASLAVIRDLGGRSRIEFPVGKVLYETAGWVSHLRVAPAGDVLAFLDHPVRRNDGGRVVVVDLEGKPKPISTDWLSLQGLAWSGREVWFTATKAGAARALYAATLDGGVRLVARAPGTMTLRDVSRDGRALVTRDEQRLNISALAPGEKVERDLSWLDWSRLRDISADGRKILFDETGEGGGAKYGTYLRGTDGTPAVRLGDGLAMALSPDGKWAVTIAADRDRMVVLPTGPGQSRVVPTSGLTLQGVNWFPDGKRLLVAANEANHAVRLYVVDLAGGTPRPITAEGVSALEVAISPDGQWAAARIADQAWSLYPVNGGATRIVPGIQPSERISRWTADGTGLFVYDPAHLPVTVYRVDLASGRRTLLNEIVAAGASPLFGINYLRLTADTSGYAYSHLHQNSELYLVSGLR